jgi:hypothetical protein
VSARLANFLFWAYILFLVWGSTTAYNPADPDLWHRLALGEALWTTGHFPSGDQFSYMADYKDVADHEWGSALIFYGLYQFGGEGAIVAVKIVTLAITITLLVWAGTMNQWRSVLTAAFYALVIFALLPSFQSTVRCMTFTHCFFALWLYWFQRERGGRPVPTWCYVVTIIPWANLHGGFAIGLAWLVMAGVVAAIEGGAWRKWALRFGLCALVTLINPFGYRLWISTGRALVTTRKGFAEWGPVSWWPDPTPYFAYKVLLLVAVVLIAVQIRRLGWRRVDRAGVLFIGVSILLSLSSARHTSLFAAVAGAFLPGVFPLHFRLGYIENPLNRLGFMAFRSALLIIPLFSTFMVTPGDGLALRYTDVACPVGAVEYLQGADVRGNLLVPFNYGSYALWELRGKMRVSMDGRYDLVYTPETYRRVDDFFYARGDWRGLLSASEKWPAPDAILVPVADKVWPQLLREPGWREAWHNKVDAVFLPR